MVIDIVTAAISDQGGDGLYNTDGGCGCVLRDLSPGGCLTGDCKVGRKVTCAKCTTFSVRDFGNEVFKCPMCGAQIEEAAR
jgi:hypothetical protein